MPCENSPHRDFELPIKWTRRLGRMSHLSIHTLTCYQSRKLLGLESLLGLGQMRPTGAAHKADQGTHLALWVIKLDLTNLSPIWFMQHKIPLKCPLPSSGLCPSINNLVQPNLDQFMVITLWTDSRFIVYGPLHWATICISPNC